MQHRFSNYITILDENDKYLCVLSKNMNNNNVKILPMKRFASQGPFPFKGSYHLNLSDASEHVWFTLYKVF
jgi:hypothetical protein